MAENKWKSASIGDLFGDMLTGEVLQKAFNEIKASINKMIKAIEVLEKILASWRKTLEEQRKFLNDLENTIQSLADSGFYRNFIDGATGTKSDIINRIVNSTSDPSIGMSEKHRIRGLLFLVKSPSKKGYETFKKPLDKFGDFTKVQSWSKVKAGDVFSILNIGNDKNPMKKVLDRVRKVVDSLDKKIRKAEDFINNVLRAELNSAYEILHEMSELIYALTNSGYYHVALEEVIGKNNFQSLVREYLNYSDTYGWNGAAPTVHEIDSVTGKVTISPNPLYIPPVQPNAPSIIDGEYVGCYIALIQHTDKDQFKFLYKQLQKVFKF